MSRFGILLLSVVGGAVLASVFGALHDQITYAISPEYYTALKFKQFGADPRALGIPLAVAKVGVLATWWVGAGLGLILGFMALSQRDATAMAHVMIVSGVLVVLTTSLAALAGGLLWPTLKDAGLHVPTPSAVKDRDAFGQVGTIHTFSYLGGALGGLCAIAFGVVYRLFERRTA